MMMPPAKLSDFFGNLSISASPWGWIAWFSYFASVIVVDNLVASRVIGLLTISLLLLAAWRVAIDTNDVDGAAFQTERRFLFGSGFGSLIICLATSADATKDQSYLTWLFVPAALIGLVLLVIALRKSDIKGKVFNFTQCYLMMMATFTGYCTAVVGLSKCKTLNTCEDHGYGLFASIFIGGWLLAFLIFSFNMLKIDFWRKPTPVPEARTDLGDIWGSRHSP